MELSEIQKQEYKAKLIDVFKLTIKFLNENHLSWWAYAGTAIGAVRHHGIIPWDDDVDIFMPYDDYCRLQKMRNELQAINLEIYTPFEGDYYLPYTKIADKNTTVSELERFHFVGGVWIDVFPLYKTNATPDDYWQFVKKYGKYFERLQGGKMHFVWSDLKFYIKDFNPKAFRHWIKNLTINRLLRKNNEIQFKHFLSTIHNPEGKNYMFPYTYMNSLNLFPIDWFRETCEMDFEDFKVKMPIDYDKILTRLYGDYMSLPPLDKRESTHSFYFVDLNKRYSYKQIKVILKNYRIKWKN